jgi:hypothetical protein
VAAVTPKINATPLTPMIKLNVEAVTVAVCSGLYMVSKIP